MADQLIKRAVVGGFVKADVTGTGDWDYGRITAFDDKTISFDSIIDGKEIKVQRAFAFKSSEKELTEAARSIDRDPKELSFIEQQNERRKKQKAAERHHTTQLNKKKRETKYDGIMGRKCPECGGAMKFANSPQDREEGVSHRCKRCGHGEKFVRKTAIPEEYYVKYAEISNHDEKTATGRKCIDSGDDIAAMLRGKSLEQVYQIVADRMEMDGSATTLEMLQERYEHLNVGMQRMNLGNVLRAHMRRTQKSRTAKIKKKD